MPKAGLCKNLGKAVKLFEPTREEFEMGEWYWDEEPVSSYLWGFDGMLTCTDNPILDTHVLQYSFTPLRQNIVLFLAAMHNEL